MAHVAGCWVGNCGGDVLARGMCRMHYDRWRKYGDPEIVGQGGRPADPDVRRRNALIRRLMDAGIYRETAEKVAAGVVGEDGFEMVLIGPGLWVLVTHE